MYTIPQLINSSAEKYPDCFLFNGEMTYRDACTKVKRRAFALQKMGVLKGDFVAIVSENSPEWCITHLAICYIGAVVVALDTALAPADHQQMLAILNVKIVFTNHKYSYLSNKYSILDIYELEKEAGELQDNQVQEEDMAACLFTSGTTANPKIVALTHKNIVKTALTVADYVRVTKNDSVIAVLPLFHVYPLEANIYAPFAVGCNIVFSPSLKPQDILQTNATHKVTIFTGIPLLWELLFDGILNKVKNESFIKYSIFLILARYGHLLSFIGLGFINKAIFKPVHRALGGNIRFLLSGGAPLKPEHFRYFYNMGFMFLEGYGLTETTGPICVSEPKRHFVSSVGKALPGNEAIIRDKNDDGYGEILLRGDAVMMGYYKNSEANSECFDIDGWFKTGDLGFIDERGDLHITGRLKNVIVLDSGKNVYPEEMESYFKTSSEIVEISIFGYKINGKELVYALVVPKTISKNSYQLVKKEIQRLNADLPPYKTIQQFAISFVPLPRTSSKKVIVREIINHLEAGHFQTQENKDKLNEYLPVAEKERMIKEYLQSRLNKKKIYFEQTLDDFGVDSLQRIDVLSGLETNFSIKIEAETFFKINNVVELIKYVAGCKDKSINDDNYDVFKSPIETKKELFLNPLIDIFLFIFKLKAIILWGFKVNNKKNIIIENTILIANHQSLMDIMLILCSIPMKKRRDLYIIGKKQVGWLKFILPFSRTIFVDRTGNVLPALKASADILRQGKSLLVFPEGTRTPDGNLLPFKIGASFLAKNLNKNIIPLTINGSFEVYPKGNLFPQIFGKNKISIEVGAIVDPNDYSILEDMNKVCRERIEKLKI